MRESNEYNKNYGYYIKAIDSRTNEVLQRPLYFNYYDNKIRTETKSMFPGFEYKASGTYIITQQPNSLENQDTVYIEDDKYIVTAITPYEIHELAGNSRKNRKKTYLIELEV